MKTTLYQIETEYLDLISQIEEQEGEITPEQDELLVINENQLKGKTVAYKEVIDNRQAFIGRIDDEIKRLQAMKKANTSLIDRLKNSLLVAVATFGDIEVGLVTFTTRLSKSVEVQPDGINDLPAEFKTVKVTEAPNKKAIKEAIEAGREVPGCRLVSNTNLRIK